MARLDLQNIEKSFGETRVLDGIELDIPSGEFLVLLGPSGCGKSTLLRIIAGLEDEDDGDVLLDGASIAHLPPAKRHIAMVFQTYALYPHLTARGNMALVLKQAGFSKAEIEERVEESARALELGPLLGRKPAELSGGQRQRVAIGRAIVRDPKVFLFDEPLSNLDAALRGSVRLEIAKLHQRLSATMVYVTHDQVEAMTLADRIAVMRAGRIEQIGTPRDLYERPETVFVAGFIGAPSMNMLDVQEIQGGIARLGDGQEVAVDAPDHGPAHLGIRPSGCEIGAEGLPATIVLSEYLGEATYVHLSLAGGLDLVVRDDPALRRTPGDHVRVMLKPGAMHLFDTESEQRIL